MDINTLKQNGAIGPYFPTLTGIAYMGAAYACVQGAKFLENKFQEKKNKKFSDDFVNKTTRETPLIPCYGITHAILASVSDIVV